MQLAQLDSVFRNPWSRKGVRTYTGESHLFFLAPENWKSAAYSTMLPRRLWNPKLWYQFHYKDLIPPVSSTQRTLTCFATSPPNALTSDHNLLESFLHALKPVIRQAFTAFLAPCFHFSLSYTQYDTSQDMLRVTKEQSLKRVETRRVHNISLQCLRHLPILLSPFPLSSS